MQEIKLLQMLIDTATKAGLFNSANDVIVTQSALNTISNKLSENNGELVTTGN